MRRRAFFFFPLGVRGSPGMSQVPPLPQGRQVGGVAGMGNKPVVSRCSAPGLLILFQLCLEGKTGIFEVRDVSIYTDRGMDTRQHS